MTEIKPTAENLQDPYVLQLIEALGKLQEEFEECDAACADLEDGLKELRGGIKVTEMDEYICISKDDIITSELNWIKKYHTKDMRKADRKYWKRMAAAAEVLLEAYIVK